MNSKFKKELKLWKNLGFLNPDNLSHNLVENLPHKYAARAIIVTNDKKIVLIDVVNKNIHNIVGGQIEDNETIEDGLKRECLEESGYNVSIIKKIGYTELWREKYISFSFCFLVKAIGDPIDLSITKEEEEEGHKICKYDYDDALNILRSELEKTRDISVQRSLLYLNDIENDLINMVK